MAIPANLLVGSLQYHRNPSNMTSRKLKIVPVALSLLALPFLNSAIAASSPTPVFSDDFNTGEVANAYGWFFYSPTSDAIPWTKAEDETAPLSGSVLQNQGSSASWTYAVKQFPVAALEKNGDSIKFSFSFHPVSNVSDGYLEIAFLKTANTIGENAFGLNPIEDANGYSIFQKVSTDPSEPSIRKTLNGAEAFATEGLEYLRVSSSPVVLGDATKAHALDLVITKTDSGMEIRFIIDGEEVGNAIDLESSFTTFNTIRLMAGSDAQVNLDNITLTLESAH